jgi:hypothetical protein
MKNKYTIEQLKNEKIAVHLPTQELWNRAMVIFDNIGVKLRVNRRATASQMSFDCDISYDNETGKEICADVYMKIHEDRVLNYCLRKNYKTRGFKIITLDQLDLKRRKSLSFENY